LLKVIKAKHKFILVLPIFSFFAFSGCNGGSDTSSNATTVTESPAVLDLIGSEIVFNPVIRFTTASECIYDNTLAIESTFPKPSDGAIAAPYVAVKNGDTMTITISPTDASFGEDLVLVLTGWVDLDNDQLIDQFSILPTLGDDTPLPSMTGQFTVNAPSLPNSGLNTASLPDFLGGDSNRSPTLAEWNSYVVGKQLVFIYLDGNVSTLSISSSTSYQTTDSGGNVINGTYDYDMASDSQGKLTLFEENVFTSYSLIDSSGYAVSAVYESDKITTTTNRTAIYDLNFYNTNEIWSASNPNPKAGGLGIHFMRIKDETITSVNEVSTTTNVTLSGTAEGSLRLYNDSSLLD
jgi:hypothetical protein